MPDWTYHTVFKPLLFALPPQQAEALTLGAVAMLSKFPGGHRLIQSFAHMQPAECLQVKGEFRSPVGIGCGFHLGRSAALSLANFGAGFIELGPITTRACTGSVARDERNQQIVADDQPLNNGLPYFAQQFAASTQPIPLIARLAHQPGTNFQQATQELHTLLQAVQQFASYVTIDTRWCLLDWTPAELTSYLQLAAQIFPRVLLLLAPELDAPRLQQLCSLADGAGVCGYVIGGGCKQDDKRVYGRTELGTISSAIAALKQFAPNSTKLIVVSDAVCEPIDALNILDGGADLVSIYSGFIYSGPGFIKRINESLTARFSQLREKNSYLLRDVLQSSWIAFACFGLGLMVACVSAITVGLTTVILPYDETFVHLQRDGFNAINKHLLHFMEHDRVTYAGTALSTGMLFAALSALGIRTGHRWCYTAVRNAGFVGICSFLLFLGFHYLDPLHAIVTALLLVFYIWGVRGCRQFYPEKALDLHNDEAWRSAQYGQLMFVCMGIGLMLAGIVICYVGISTVFVHEDLMFMQISGDLIRIQHPNLLAAIAHDRAGFGGALVTIGIAVLITALHGFRRGHGWVWWTLTICALPALASTVAIHYFIGYTNQFHLLPVYIALALYIAGAALSYKYLCQPT